MHGKSIRRLTFNHGLALTSFRTTWPDHIFPSILDYFTLDRQKLYFPIQHKSQELFVYHVLESLSVPEFRCPNNYDCFSTL